MSCRRVCVVGGGGGLLEVCGGESSPALAKHTNNNQKETALHKRQNVMLFSRVFHETFLFSSSLAILRTLLFFFSHSRELHSFWLVSRIRRIKNYIVKYIFYMFALSLTRALSLTWIFFIFYFVYIFFLLFSLSLSPTHDGFFFVLISL